MKHTILYVIILAITFSICTALGETIAMTADSDAGVAYATYASYVEHGDEWSACADEAFYQMKLIENGAYKSEMSAGTCFIYPSLRGDATRGLVEVVLHVCVFRSASVEGTGLFISVDGIRYGYLAQSTRESMGRYKYDHYALALDGTGMDMLREMAEHGCDIYAYGGGKPYRAEAVQAPWFGEFIDALPSWYGGYLLWDENAARWLDGRPTTDVWTLETVADTQPVFDDMFNIVPTDDKTSVVQLQQLLADAHLYASKIDGKYEGGTKQAVAEAQRRYGLSETGIADVRLVRMLSGTGVNPSATPQPAALGGFVPRGYRVAKTLEAMAAYTIEDGDAITAGSDDTRLLIIEGDIINSGGIGITLPLEFVAEIVVDGAYRYPCVIRCERRGDTQLKTSMIPLESAKLYMIAELPLEALARGEAKLVYTFGGEMSEYVLAR